MTGSKLPRTAPTPETAAAVGTSSGPRMGPFLEMIGPLRDLWNSLDVRYAAIKQDGIFRNLFTRASLSFEICETPTSDILVSTPDFRAGRLRFPRERGLEWLLTIENDIVSVDGESVRLDYLSRVRATDSGQAGVYGWTHFLLTRSGELANLRTLGRQGLRGIYLMGNGGVVWELFDAGTWDRLKNRLLALPKPFGGLEDLTSAYIGYPEGKGPNHVTSFDVVAPIDAGFIGWKIREDRTFVGSFVHPPSLKPHEISLTAILSASAGVERQHPSVPEFEPESSGAVPVRSFTLQLHDYHRIRLHLMIRGEEVDVLEVVLPAPGGSNPRQLALFGLDQISQTLAETLARPESVKNSHRLELAVAWLFHLYGLQVMPTDVAEFAGGDVPDVIGYDPYLDRAVAVEVTVKDPLSNDKLSKHRRRTDRLIEKSSGVTWYSLIVAPARENFYPTELGPASALGVVVWGAPELRTLLDGAGLNPLPSAVFDSLAKGNRTS
jgi:hypothetical protein